MHFAPFTRPFVVGLAVVSQMAMLPPLALGEGSSIRVQSATDGVPETGSLRFVSPVINNGKRIVDHSVQQAAWNNAAPVSNQRRFGQTSSNQAARSSGASVGRRGPMYRGSEIRIPSLFNRNTKGPKSAWDPRQAAQQAPTTSEPVGSLPGRDPASIYNPHVPTALPAARRTPPAQQPYPNPPRIGAPAAGLRIVASEELAHAAPGSRQPLPAQSAPSQSVNSAASAAPKSAADYLVLQAHEMSSDAASENDFSSVIATCRKALENQPSVQTTKYANDLLAWALNRRGQLMAEDGRTKEAMLDFENAIRANAECWRAVHNRGVLFAQDSNFEKAFDDFNRTIQLNPQFAKAYSNRGALFVVAGNLNSALDDYRRAIELDPNLSVAHRGCGRVCHLFGQLEKALTHYDAAVRLVPQDAYAIASRGDLLTDLGRYPQANADYERAIQLDTHSVHAHSGSAWLLATCPDQTIRNPKLAIVRANKAIELNGSPEAVNFDTLAAAQASVGDFAAAAESIRKAIAIAAEGERDVYQDRLAMYQHGQPYRISPVRPVAQVSYEE